MSMKNESNIEYIKKSIAGYEISIDKRKEDYIVLRNTYEIIARDLREEVRKCYKETDSFSKIIEKASEIVANRMSTTIDMSMKVLYELDIAISPEAFFEKYYYKSEYRMDYNQIIECVVEEYANIMDEKIALENYRSMVKASRSRWQGGGFGIKGAMKGALMAGALNLGTDFMRSFGDAAQSKEDRDNIQKKINKLRNSDLAKGQIIGGAYRVIIGVFLGVLNELRERGKCLYGYEEGKYENAKSIFKAAQRYEKDENKYIESAINAILQYPYYDEPYEIIYEKVKGHPQEVELFDLMNMFGVNIDFYGITPNTYMKIENMLDTELEKLKKIDYINIQPKEYFILLNIVNKLKNKFQYSELLRNYRVNEIFNVINNAPFDEYFDYEDNEDKICSMAEYVKRVLIKSLDMGMVRFDTFDGFLWASGVWFESVFCDYLEDEDNIYYNKYNKFIDEIGEEYLMVYENSVTHLAKRGFGIVSDRIIFFENGKNILFKDIKGIEYNDSRKSMIIIYNNVTYEFEYKFFGGKIYELIDQEEVVRKGEILTKIIGKIVKHYQELCSNGRYKNTDSKSNKYELFMKDSSEEKECNMNDYIRKTLEKCLKMKLMSIETFDGYLWSNTVYLNGSVADYLHKDNFYYRKFKRFIDDNMEYLLIYENSKMHLAKRGFGIVSDRIIFFEDGKNILFKDIEMIQYNNDKKALVIKYNRNNYLFEYNFLGGKIFELFEKDAFKRKGEVLTSIVHKIVNHYKELNDNISDKKIINNIDCVAEKFDEFMENKGLIDFEIVNLKAENYIILRQWINEFFQENNIETIPKKSKYYNDLYYYFNAIKDISPGTITWYTVIDWIPYKYDIYKFIGCIRADRYILLGTFLSQLWLYGDELIATNHGPRMEYIEEIEKNTNDKILICYDSFRKGNKGFIVSTKYILDFRTNTKIQLSSIKNITLYEDMSIIVTDDSKSIEIKYDELNDEEALTYFSKLLRLICIRYGKNCYLKEKICEETIEKMLSIISANNRVKEPVIILKDFLERRGINFEHRVEKSIKNEINDHTINKFCTWCGKQIGIEAGFCTWCGKQI